MHDRDWRTPGGSRQSPWSGASVGVVVLDSTAILAGRPSPAALASSAGCQPRHFVLYKQTGGLKRVDAQTVAVTLIGHFGGKQ